MRHPDLAFCEWRGLFGWSQIKNQILQMKNQAIYVIT